MDFFNIFCLTIFLFICYLIIDLSKTEFAQEIFNEYLTEDEFIHVIYYEEESANVAVNETNVSINEPNDNNNLQRYQIEEETSLLETKLNKSEIRKE
ncbi:17304_t:CDS:1, partial [Gigaspora margarita]